MPCSIEEAYRIANRTLEGKGNVLYFSLPVVNNVVLESGTASIVFSPPLQLKWRFWIVDRCNGEILFIRETAVTIIKVSEVDIKGHFHVQDWHGELRLLNDRWAEIRDIQFTLSELLIPEYCNPDSLYAEVLDYNYVINHMPPGKEREDLKRRRYNRIHSFAVELMSY